MAIWIPTRTRYLRAHAGLSALPVNKSDLQSRLPSEKIALRTIFLRSGFVLVGTLTHLHQIGTEKPKGIQDDGQWRAQDDNHPDNKTKKIWSRLFSSKPIFNFNSHGDDATLFQLEDQV